MAGCSIIHREPGPRPHALTRRPEPESLPSQPSPDSVALNDSLREYPHPSARYRELFNQTARELQLDLQWTGDTRNANAIDPGELKVEGQTPQSFSPQLKQTLQHVLQTLEDKRLAAVQESALFHRRIPFRGPLELLTPAERQAVERFTFEVKPLLDRIEARQHDPRADEQREWMSRHGDFYSNQCFQRTHRDEGVGPPGQNELCSLMPFFPDHLPVNGMVDRTITLDEIQQLTDPEALRPTTLLKRDAEGAIYSTPMPTDPAFREDHQALAGALDRIAELDLEPALKTQCSAWARFFRTGTAQDERTAVQATIDAGDAPGLLRLHLGPSESYWPDNMKFPYELQVGVRDPDMMQDLKAWQANFPDMEASLADIPHYAPRQLDLRGGFADPLWMTTTGGFCQTFAAREPRGTNFPNYPYGTTGSNRFIPLDAYPPILDYSRQVSEKLLDVELPAPETDLWNEVLLATGHESGHLLGPQRDHVTPGGQHMGTVFGDHWGSADEPKADLTALEMASRGHSLTQDEKRDLYVANLQYMLTLYPGKREFEADHLRDHRFGFMLQTGWFFQTGALSLQEGKLHVDFPKMEEAAHDLWRRIIACQAGGDLGGFLALSREAVAAIPEEADQTILQAQGGYREYFVEHHL